MGCTFLSTAAYLWAMEEELDLSNVDVSADGFAADYDILVWTYAEPTIPYTWQ